MRKKDDFYFDSISVLQQMAEFANGNHVDRVNDLHESSSCNNYDSHNLVFFYLLVLYRKPGKKSQVCHYYTLILQKDI